ncbi:phosphoribosylaminoimidazolesuccinocarboxamide synthase [Salinirubrum litoreum]|uniref:Phosphoribosylaminoimidazole-succinocarboxamide synthase n=1 Tax=Salinirubrum litoreum TaxID=1126234 RepID=A0ABD5RCM1_9EURY|nr:phosphoribosylaminoimidazolesuccinocarboxamide synthase [Salinirubrum litoreum]
MTSVKEFRVDREPTAEELGRGAFVFTDDYSVFDWGTMPDTIPGKGASLCTMGAFNFELFDVNHIPTHYRGVVDPASVSDADESGESTADAGTREIVDLGDAPSAPREMAIDLTQVPDLPYDAGEYDYEAFHREAGENYLIPLEIVFRNTVPLGSSLRKRREPAELDLDYDEWPDEVVDLPRPVVEFSTKFEEQDRYLSRDEADAIAGHASVDRLEELALAVNHMLTDRASRADFTHEDGKIECLYHDGAIKVADVAGTFDENRFGYAGQEVSKEVVRQWYKREQPEWVEAVGDAKAEADAQGVADWRTLCAVEPRELPHDVRQAVANLYAAGANAYTGSEWFEAPDIDAAVDAVRDL